MLTVKKLCSHSTIDFAAEELKKYFRMMMPDGEPVKIAYDPEARDGFRLGLMKDFGLSTDDVKDPELDDIVYIDCDERGGIIAGSNTRSVLIAVYEYLKKNGCRWLFPGVDGEYIPTKNIEPVKYRKAADSRFRGNCIEGAVEQSLLLDYIDFMPKLALNTFMVQFRIPGAFYDRYYNHNNTNLTYAPESVSTGTVLSWTRCAECEMEKRGVMLHYYGHGFTADPFGLENSTGWGRFSIDALPEEKREFVAMMNGVRDFNGGAPVNTNFCMSNPNARRDVVKYIADYCEGHPNVDYLHVWLADGRNNHCECHECQKKTPSDWYVVLMNEADEELTARGLASRIVFISYVDTSWAPTSEVIKNPDRFTLMIAPITRDYKKTLNGDENPVMQPYVRNKLKMPADLAEYLAYFDEWKKSWKGANVCFDYHFWVHTHYDISGLAIPRRLYEDTRLYRERGLDGIIQCGTQRSFFPSGFSFSVHARTLFDKDASFEELARDYFSHAYGEDWQEFYAFFESLEEAFPYNFFTKARYSESIRSDEMADRLDAFPELIAKGRELVAKHYNSEHRVGTVSVRVLEHYLGYAELVAAIAAAKARGLSDEAERRFDVFVREFSKMEPHIKPYADISQNIATVKQLLSCEAGGDMELVVE